jgi:hypothetical protein
MRSFPALRSRVEPSGGLAAAVFFM